MKFKLSVPIFIFGAVALGLAIYHAEVHVALKWAFAAVGSGFIASYLRIDET